MLKKILKKLIPHSVRATLRSYKILSLDFGHFKSMSRWECVDKHGNPIPWYSYPAIEYLKQIDLSDKTVFEYGSGNSTLYWAARCKKLYSVEDDQQWYAKVKSRLPEKVTYILLEDKDGYVGSIGGHSEKFDVVVIDGSHRYECASKAIEHLKDDGFIILDNSEWEKHTSRALRDADLIEVDMSGFGPINGYTTTTSFYFSRNVSLKPAYDRQPVYGIGSIHHNED